MDPKNTSSANVEIETSTDSVEQVKEALGESAEIDDTTETETEKEKPAETESEEEEESTETETETKEGEETEEAAEEEKGEKKEAVTKKPAAKPAPNLIPRARLNEEIDRRKKVERELADARKAKPAATATEVEEESTEPQTFSGKPEPTIESYLGNEKYPDPYAAFTKDHGAWVRAETMAEIAQNQQAEAAERERTTLVSNFNKNVKETEKRHPDYKEVVTDSQVQLSGFMERRVYKSPIGPDMLLYFAKNPEKAEEICAMDLDDQAAEMVQLEARLRKQIAKAAKTEETEEEAEEEAEEEPAKTATGKVLPKKTPTTKTTSTAPEPPKRVKANGPAPKSLEELAGPTDKSGVDIDYNPEYERAVKAGQRR